MLEVSDFVGTSAGIRPRGLMVSTSREAIDGIDVLISI